MDVLERGLAIPLRGMIGSAGVLTRPELGAPRHGTNVLLWDTTSCRTAPPLTQSLTHPTLTTGVRYLFALAKVANEFVQLKTRGSAWGSHLLLRPEMAPATVVTVERNPGFQTFCSEFPGSPRSASPPRGWARAGCCTRRILPPLCWVCRTPRCTTHHPHQRRGMG